VTAREPSFAEYAAAALAALIAAALAEALAIYLWFLLENKPTLYGALLTVLTSGLRRGAARATVLVALAVLARRGVRSAPLLGASLVLALLEKLAAGIGLWIYYQFKGIPIGGQMEEMLADVIRGIASRDGLLEVALIGLGVWLATLSRRTSFTGLFIGGAVVLHGFLRLLWAGLPAAGGVYAARFCAYGVVVAISLPLALRLVPRAFEKIGLAPREEEG
jgi:hypothetical protein